MEYLLVVFVPGRARVGALEAAFGKLGLQYVAGCGEPPVRAAFGDRAGLLLTLVGWTPARALERGGKVRVTLPEAVRGALAAVGGAPPGDPFEMAVLAPGGELRGEARLDLAKLDQPVQVGCRYAVSGTVAAPP